MESQIQNTDSESNVTLEYKLSQVIIIGIVATGATIFGYFQLAFFNTYIKYVLDLTPLHIALMVSLSAIVGLLAYLMWSVISDNLRTELGRRKPFLLLGIIAGISMIMFSFTTDYLSGLLLRILVLEITINAYYATQRVLIADLVPIEHRGRANGIVGVVATAGMAVAVLATLHVNEVYVHNGELNQAGHLFLFTVGGMSIIICAIIGFIFLKEIPGSELPPRKTFMEDLKDTFQYPELRKHSEYFKILIGTSIFTMGLLIVAPYMFIYIFGLGLSNFQWILTAVIIGIFIAIFMFLVGKLADKIGRKKVIPPVMILASVGFIMLPFVGNESQLIFPLFIVAVILALMGFNGVMVPVSAWAQDLLPEGKKAQFIGISNVLSTATAIPGAIIGAIIYEILGIEWIFAFVPIFFILSLPIFLSISETLPEAIDSEK